MGSHNIYTNFLIFVLVIFGIDSLVRIFQILDLGSWQKIKDGKNFTKSEKSAAINTKLAIVFQVFQAIHQKFQKHGHEMIIEIWNLVGHLLLTSVIQILMNCVDFFHDSGFISHVFGIIFIAHDVILKFSIRCYFDDWRQEYRSENLPGRSQINILGEYLEPNCLNLTA